MGMTGDVGIDDSGAITSEYGVWNDAHVRHSYEEGRGIDDCTVIPTLHLPTSRQSVPRISHEGVKLPD